METLGTIGFLLLIVILILLVWNIYEFIKYKKGEHNAKEKYFELKAKLNFIVAVGSLSLLLLTYLGFNVKRDILKQSKPMMDELVAKKGKEIDSLLENKNILKAGIYIVSDIKFKEDSIYYFKLLKTIDNKPLPIFNTNPKLIINTNTGENLRIKELTKNYFILEKYKSKYIGLSVGKNQEYTPIELRFDIWIADYYGN